MREKKKQNKINFLKKREKEKKLGKIKKNKALKIKIK